MPPPSGPFKALITETLDPACADWLSTHAQVDWCSHEDTAQLATYLADADALVVRTYTQVDQRLLDQAPRLKVVGRAGVGLDNIDLAACRQRGVEVVYTPDANTQAVAEYTLALMLDELRPRAGFNQHISPDRFHKMRKDLVGQQMDSLTLGLLGFGSIGRRLGAMAHAMGMKLLVNDILPEAELRDGVGYPFDYVDKDRFYSQSDVVSIHADGRVENRHLINAAALAKLKPTCLLINTSRGLIIDNTALAQWAKSVRQAGGRAVLDVHDPEPPPEDYPLLGTPNVRLLPHLASRTHQAMLNMSWVVRDVVAVLNGQPPSHPATQ